MSFILYYIISYYIILYYITLHYIASHRIASHRIASHHITLYYIIMSFILSFLLYYHVFYIILYYLSNVSTKVMASSKLYAAGHHRSLCLIPPFLCMPPKQYFCSRFAAPLPVTECLSDDYRDSFPSR